jgi:hypothetical protein
MPFVCNPVFLFNGRYRNLDLELARNLVNSQALGFHNVAV